MNLECMVHRLSHLQRFKDKPLPTVNQDALDHELIKRAIGMHFLREGEFEVASAFADDVKKQNGRDNILSPHLVKAFKEMYGILEAMKAKNLKPALAWARQHSASLEARGSDLAFEISRLQFVWLFMGDLPRSLSKALVYARQEFGGFQSRYQQEIHELAAAMAFSPNLADSPYKRIFYNENAWEELGQSFTKEFCSLLGLSADSPMYIAVTAGAIALPVLQKYQSIMQLKRTEWTTEDELPVSTASRIWITAYEVQVEIPLPRNYRFHSIFVCPVSKEQTTDENPPMMMPCGHVVAKESLDMISKSIRFKCPYCPSESKPADARRVII